MTSNQIMYLLQGKRIRQLSVLMEPSKKFGTETWTITMALMMELRWDAESNKSHETYFLISAGHIGDQNLHVEHINERLLSLQGIHGVSIIAC